MKSIRVTNDKELVVASRNPYCGEIVIAEGEYGWIALIGARNIDIHCDGHVAMKSLALSGCHRLRISGVKLELGPARSPTARVLDIKKSKYIRFQDVEVAGNPSTRHWRDVPDAMMIDHSMHIHFVECRIHHVRSVARVIGANEDLVLDRCKITEAMESEVPGAFTLKGDAPQKPELPLPAPAVNDDRVIQWRGKSWRVMEGPTIFLMPLEEVG